MGLDKAQGGCYIDHTMRRAREIRQQKGLTLEAVTAATGLDGGRLSRFERGGEMMVYSALKRLSDYYGVTIDEMIEEADGTPSLS